jgi:AcrR family transcriptional regulator
MAEVIAAARTIVETSGAESLTMRRLADSLGLSTMAVYRYVSSKDELLSLLLDESIDSLSISPSENGPKAEIVATYVAMRDGLKTQGWAFDVLVRGYPLAPAAFPLLDRIYGALMDCGLSRKRAVAVNRMLWNMMIGDVIASRRADDAAGVRGPLTDVDMRTLPNLAQVLPELSRNTDTFEEDLTTMLSSLGL